MKISTKAGIIGASILASAVIGDKSNITDKVINPIKYRNVAIAENCYKQPFKLQKKYAINNEGRLEVYIGHDNTYHKIGKDLRVNERNLSEMLKKEADKIMDGTKKWGKSVSEIIKTFIDWYIEQMEHTKEDDIE